MHRTYTYSDWTEFSTQRWLALVSSMQEATNTVHTTASRHMTSTASTQLHVDKHVFAAFLETQQDQILQTAMRMLRDREDTLDILQEVALRLYKHWHNLDLDKNIQG